LEAADASWTGESVCDSATRTANALLREPLDTDGECLDLCLAEPDTFLMTTHTARLINADASEYATSSASYNGTCPAPPAPVVNAAHGQGTYQQTIKWWVKIAGI